MTVFALLVIAPFPATAGELVCFEEASAGSILCELETCRVQWEVCGELGVEYEKALSVSKAVADECEAALEMAQGTVTECSSVVKEGQDIVEDVKEACVASMPTFWERLRERISFATGGALAVLLAGVLLF